MIDQAKRLTIEQLATRYDEERFPFTTTAELGDVQAGIIGQKRAVRAMEFGLNVKQEGYNLFLVGPIGTGKTTYALSKISHFAEEDSTPFDWLYVYNFRHPDKPIAISLPAGKGVVFQREVEELIKDIKSEVEKVFTSKEFAQKKLDIIQQHEDSINEEWQLLNDMAFQEGFHIERSQEGIMAVPLNNDGEPYTDDIFRKLSKKEQQSILDTSKEINKKLNDISRKTQFIERDLRKKVKEMEEATVYHSIHIFVQQLMEKYKQIPKIVEYLNCLERDVIENWSDFHESSAEEENTLLMLLSQREQKEDYRYHVNLFIDNSQTKGAPVVFESNPTYSNLFGKLEYKSAFGSLVSNFTKIKPGAMHLANGGYVIIQASDLLSNPLSWHALKRMLKTREIKIENILEDSGASVVSGMKPEPIPVHLKVVLIGTPEIYHLLNHYDEDFSKYFKVKVDFDTTMERNDEHCMKYAAFVSSYCETNNLRHFTSKGLSRVIDFSTRLSSDKRKLSTCFHEVTEILVEANYWAELEGETYVDAKHVKKALKERFYRSNLIEEKIKESIDDGTIMIQTEGEAIGQINGLSVLNTGDYVFGQPNKITARTFIGSKGIVNIDRESYLSGPIHSKGLFILSGFIQGEFARNYPIPLSASITFEQSYDLVDGDSASSTELYAILSSLSEVPIKQGIAVTGSVNQLGQIQPIGGVNEKIEGFFYTCKSKGFTGGQGVIIPAQNVKHLMLRNEVIDAVEKGMFSVWAVETIHEGIEILTGVDAGARDNLGRYPKESVFGRVEKRLQQMSSIFRREKEERSNS